MHRTVLFALASLVCATEAGAYPFLSLRPAGSPFEGPADAEVSALWWNPAALGLLRGFHASFDGQLLLERGAVERTPICLDTGLTGTCASGRVQSFPAAAIGDNSFTGFGGIAWDFRQDNVTVAFGVSAPWQSQRSFSPSGSGATDATLGSTGTPTAYHLRSESFTTLYYTLALGLKLTPSWNVGASLSLTESFADLRFDRDTALDGGSQAVSRTGYESPAAAQGIHVRGDGGSTWRIPSPSGLAIGLGITFRPADRVLLGASWQRMFPLGNPSYSVGDAIGASVTGAGSAACGGSGCTGGDAIDFDLPDVWHLGARIRLRDNLELSSWARVVVYGPYHPPGPEQDLVVRLSGPAVDSGAVPARLVLARALVPTFAGEIGVRWRVRPWLRLGASVVAESSAVPSAHVNPAALDGPKVDGMIAGELKLRWFRLMIGYELGALIFAANSPSSPDAFDPGETVRCADARYSLDACAGALAGRGLPTSAGHYSLIKHRFSIGVGLDF